MLSMERDDLGGDGDRRAPWFPPSAPPLSPLPNELDRAPWIEAPRAPPDVQAPPPIDFHHYPAVAYGSIGAPPPPPPSFAFPGHLQASGPSNRMYIAQRAGDPAPPVHPRHAGSRRHRRSAGTQRHSYNLTWAFSVMARFMLLLFFNTANGVLGLCGAAVVWVGVLLSIATLPLCGFGIVLFHSLLRVACYLCQVDVVIHNALADANHKITFTSSPYYGGEHESLLPTRAITRRPGDTLNDWRMYRFERTLYEPSPRSILATIYFGTVKFALGVLSLAAVGLLLIDVGFLIGDKRVQIDIPHMDEHPLTVYLVSLALLLVALVLVHGLAEISKRVTRFFCCEVDLSRGM